MSIVEILLIAAAVVYVLGRRLAGEPLQSKRLALLPLVLVVWGLSRVAKLHPSTVDVFLLVLEALVAFGLGLLRGATIQLYERAGHLWYRYRPLTIVVWVASIAIRIGMGVGGHLLGATLSPTASLTAVLGVTFLGEAVVVGARAARTGLPFAPRRRSTAGAGGWR